MPNQKGYNKHHLSWQRREWSYSHITRRVREHPGLIIPLPIKLHNELHAEIPPIRPPHLVLARVVLASLYSAGEERPEIAIPGTTDFLWQLAEDDTRMGHEAYRLAQHYEDQIEFLGLRQENIA